MSDPAPKPIPVPDAASAEFFEGARQGRFMIQRCSQCGNHRFIARGRCDTCRSREFEWVAASGKATLVSYAVMHQRYHPGFFDEIPYPLAVVELEEGPRLITSLKDAPVDKLTAGLPLNVVFEPAGDDIVLPKFTPA